MAERLANMAESTLTDAIDADDTTLSVASASLFPNAGNFRVRVDSELMVVTAVSGGDFTVTRGAEGTTATTHSSSSTVEHVLTAAGLLQYIVENAAALGLTASRALATNGSGTIVVSAVTAAELAYLSGVTSALQAQIDAKAALASPTFTGTPAGPTAAPGTSTTQLATTAFVAAATAAVIDAAPGALDTLNELAAALGDDANFASTVTTSLAGKQPIDATLTAFAGLTISANSIIVGTGADAFSVVACAANQFVARSSSGDLAAKSITDFGLSLVDDADASAGRTTLGLGTIATAAAADFCPVDKATLTYGATTDVDFSAAGGIKTLSLTGNVTFTTSNRTAARQPVLIRIIADGSARTFTFPSWKWIGAVPTGIAASKTGVLSLTCFGTNDSDVVAAYAVQE